MSPIINREDRSAIASLLLERLAAPVAIDVWSRKESTLIRTDRDPCTHCDDTVQAAREVAALHPALSITLYDLDRHADRAAEAGIDRPPTTVVRAHGAESRILGYWSGLLFPAFIDTLLFTSAGGTPLTEQSRATLADLPADVTVEAMVTPYDPYSAQMMRLTLALGIESHRVHAQVTEASEFPMLAAARGVTEVPVLLVNGRRHVGAWGETELVELVRRAAAGDDEPVIRERVLSTPYMTEDEAKQMAAQQAAQPGAVPGAAPGMAPGAAPPPDAGGGLFVPGRD